MKYWFRCTYNLVIRAVPLAAAVYSWQHGIPYGAAIWVACAMAMKGLPEA